MGGIPAIAPLPASGNHPDSVLAGVLLKVEGMRNLADTLCLAAAAGFALVSFAAPRRAEACGACMSPSDQVTVVESHRMAVALGVEETLLWDQIIYTGDPEDFVWVLPVTGPDVSVELADPAFLDWIDADTSPVVRPARPLVTTCPSSGSSGAGCGAQPVSAAGDGDGDGDGDGGGVSIENHEVVGPYETVTITSSDPEALYTWLTENGYQITEAARPAIDYYVGAGFSFVALRLAPGQGVDAMQPVRVRYPSFMGTFPLKMVVIGARGVLDLSLWIIADQRYDAFNYGTVEMSPDDITWDWATNSSDYNQAFARTAQENGNRAWIAEYAEPLDDISWAVPEAARADLQEATRLVKTPFLTRLRTQILVDNVDEDLVLAPAKNATPIATNIVAGLEVNRPPEPDCGSDEAVACASASSRQAGGTLFLVAAAIALVFRRRRAVVKRR